MPFRAIAELNGELAVAKLCVEKHFSNYLKGSGWKAGEIKESLSRLFLQVGSFGVGNICVISKVNIIMLMTGYC